MKIILPIIFAMFATVVFAQKKPLPIIDMHMHANRADFAGAVPMTICIHNSEWPVSNTGAAWGDSLMQAAKTCKHPIVSEKTDEDVMNKALAVMRRRNIYGVVSGRLTDTWKSAEPTRIIASLIYRADGKDPSVDSVRTMFKSGRFKVFGEIEAQYKGMRADDSTLAAYWALAEELDIPVGIHIGPGPIGAPYLGWNKIRGRLHSPLQLEEILIRHPRLRVYIMHAAWPMIDELLALMWSHPQVHVDISGIVTDLSQPAFYSYLKQIMDAGFGNRVMFGSDQMIWPKLIEEALSTIETAPFLSKAQKRNILYNNAARFLNLSREEINSHHK
jgi:predicted TIM-barrel fold metal-dependent hydrolase